MCQSQLRATSVSSSWGSHNPAKKRLFSIRSLFLKFQLIKAIHYENGDTLNLHDTRKGALFFFFLTHPYSVSGSLRLFRENGKKSLPKNTGTFVFLERSRIQAGSKGISTFQLRYNPGREADGDIKRGKTLKQVTKNTCCPLSAFQSP